MLRYATSLSSLLACLLPMQSSGSAAEVTCRLYQGVTAYVDNSKGGDFTVELDVRDLNIFANGPREILFKVYDPDGQAVVREYIPDDGVESKHYLPRIGGWDHELEYYELCRSKGTLPMGRWSAWSDPARLKTLTARTFTRQIQGAKAGVYRIVLVGDRDHYVTLKIDPEREFGLCGHTTWLHGHHDLWKQSFMYVPKGATGMHVAFAEPDTPRTRRLKITAPDGAVLFDGSAPGGFIETNVAFKAGQYDDKVLRVEVSSGDGDYLLRASLKYPGGGYGGTGAPAVLCRDQKTAQTLRGGAIYADGKVYWHPWQIRLDRWLAANQTDAKLKATLTQLRPYFLRIGPSDGRDAAGWVNWAYAMGYYGFKIWRPVWLLSKDNSTPSELMSILREACVMTADRLSFALDMERVNGNAFAQIPVHLWYAQAITGDQLLKKRYDVWFERWRNEGWGEGAGISKSGDSQEHFAHDADYGSYIIDNWLGKSGGGGTWLQHGILSDTDDPRFQQVVDRMMNLFSHVYCRDALAYPWNSRINGRMNGAAQKLIASKYGWKGDAGPNLTVSVNDGNEWFAARRPTYYMVTFHGRLAPRWLTETFWGQIGFGGGCIAQLGVPGKGTVLNSHPSGQYGKKMHVSNWRNYHIHGVVGEMWDGTAFAAGISEHNDAQIKGSTVTSSGNVRDRHLRSIRKYTFGDTAIDCEVKLSRPQYQDIMTLWSKDRPYAHVRLAYEMIPYTAGKVTLLNSAGKSLGDLSSKPVETQTVFIDRDGYGVRIEFAKPAMISSGLNKTILVELVAGGGSKPTAAEDVSLSYTLRPFKN